MKKFLLLVSFGLLAACASSDVENIQSRQDEAVLGANNLLDPPCFSGVYSDAQNPVAQLAGTTLNCSSFLSHSSDRYLVTTNGCVPSSSALSGVVAKFGRQVSTCGGSTAVAVDEYPLTFVATDTNLNLTVLQTGRPNTVGAPANPATKYGHLTVGPVSLSEAYKLTVPSMFSLGSPSQTLKKQDGYVFNTACSGNVFQPSNPPGGVYQFHHGCDTQDPTSQGAPIVAVGTIAPSNLNFTTPRLVGVNQAYDSATNSNRGVTSTEALVFLAPYTNLSREFSGNLRPVRQKSPGLKHV